MAFVSERNRFWIIVSVLLAVATCVGYRLVAVHLGFAELDVRDPRYWFTREIRGLRGGIYSDTCGRQPFACSLPVWEYHVDPQGVNLKLKHKDGTFHSRETEVQTVARAMNMDVDKVREIYWRVNSRYVPLGTTDRDDVHKIMSDRKKVTGVAIEERQVRRYPQGTMLSHVLGYTSFNRESGNPYGARGLEFQYEKFLKGKSGRIKGMRDARGREIRERRVVDVDPTPGANLYLTIDHNVQYIVEKALYDGFTNCQARAGWAIVLDVRKGAVLAMATYPTFDPSKSGDQANFRWIAKDRRFEFIHYNRCISENHEPGSVMKTITACAVLNEGMATADTLINTDRNDPDFYRLPGDGSHKWEPFMSVRDALVHSSNIVYGKLGYRLGPRRLRHYFSAFGFGKKTGIDLPDEEGGILPPWGKWDKASWSRAPIGQYIAVTPIQMAMAYGAIANGGKLMKPYVVDRVVATDGEVLFRNEPTVVGQPITAETARRVREMIGVARPGGTARRAAVKGYSIAGKTGTAQMREGKGYSKMNYNASFIGILPASDPSVVILVTYQKPEHCISYKYHEQTGLPLYNHQGGVCAAPVFRNIAVEVSKYLGIEPDRPEELVEE